MTIRWKRYPTFTPLLNLNPKISLSIRLESGHLTKPNYVSKAKANEGRSHSMVHPTNQWRMPCRQAGITDLLLLNSIEEKPR